MMMELMGAKPFNPMMLAERVGFEPTLPFRVNTLSKRAPSATRPSLPVKDSVNDQKLRGKLLQMFSTNLELLRFYGPAPGSATAGDSSQQSAISNQLIPRMAGSDYAVILCVPLWLKILVC